MKPRVLIGMLVAGKDLRDLMEAQTEIVMSAERELQRQELTHIRYVHTLIENLAAGMRATCSRICCAVRQTDAIPPFIIWATA